MTWVPARVILAIMAFLMFLVTQMIRADLYIVVVAMKDEHSVNSTSNLTMITAPGEGMGVLMGSFYWCYWLSELPGGLLANKFGSRRILGLGVFVASLLNLVLPAACHHHYITAACVRALQGLSLGVTWPAMHWLSARWIPQTERSKFMTSYHGAAVGTALTYPLSGFLINFYGWESVFYTVGYLSLLWCLAWWLLIYDSPLVHPRISRPERVYLEEELGNAVTDVRSERPPTPWRSILCSKPFWAVLVASQGLIWGTITLSMQVPTYFRQVHNLDIRTNGLLSGVPETCKFVFGMVISYVMDRLLRTKRCTITTIRKSSVIICEYIPALLLILLSYLGGSSVTLATVLLAMTSAVGGASSSGSLANIVDLSPNHAGTILGLVKTVTVIPGVISPLIVEHLISNTTSPSWTTVFLITSGFYVVCCTFFLVYGSGDVQPWNNKQVKNGEGVEQVVLIMEQLGREGTKIGEEGKEEEKRNS